MEIEDINNDDFTVGFDDFVIELDGQVSSSSVSSQNEVLENATKSENQNIVVDEKQEDYSFYRVYDLLIKDKSPSISFEQYLKTKPEVYLLFDLVPFEPLPDNFLGEVEAFRDKCFFEVDKIWADNSENIEKASLVKECLLEIESIFKYWDSEDSTYEKDLENFLYNQLYVSFKEKTMDGILELSEIQNLLRIAIQIKLWDGKSGKRLLKILSWIKTKTIEDNCRMESYWDTFIRNVKNKSPFAKFNVEHCLENLYKEYRNYKLIELHVNNQPGKINDEELKNEMLSILKEKNLLVDNMVFYEENFFVKEKKRSKINFSLPLHNDYFYYLKGLAINTYQFSENQWEDFTSKHHILKMNDMSVAFIMGTQKASSIENIANLLENNSSKAIERIIDGDLETYLVHIEQFDLAKKVEQIKNDYKNDKLLLLKNVVNILRGIENSDEISVEDVDDRQTLMAIINRDAPVQEMVAYLLKRKTKEKLNQRILGESNDRTSLNEYLNHKNVSFVSLCLNYLRNYPEESNASGYKAIYEKYADYVLNVLIERNEYKLFFTGFIHILHLDLLSQSFIDKLNESNNNMKSDYEKYCSDIERKSRKKSFFGF